MPGKSSNLNNLYETNDNYMISDMKSELNVKAEKKWDVEGYKTDSKNTEKSSFISNLQAISSSNNIKNDKSGNYSGISNNPSNLDYYASNSVNNKYMNKKNEEEYDPNSQQKKKLMNDLFGGLDTTDTSKKEKKNKKIAKNNEKNIFNNLNTNQNNNINNNNNAQVNNTNKNLFEGLTQNFNNNNNNLNSSKTNTNTNTNINNYQQNSNTNQENNVDLLGNLFGQTYQTNNNNNNNSNANASNINDLFGNFSAPQQINTNNNTNNNNYSPFNITTEQFGEMWENYPDEDEFNLNINIQSPQQFHQIIKTKGNFAPVDIINNEAISAANYKNQIALVHASIEMNQINLLVKCQNKSYNNEVGYYIMGLFK